MSAAKTTIYLMRHGETDYNHARRFQGSRDIALNETGIYQAELLAEHLREVQFDAIYSSHLQRAIVTARHIALPRGLQIHIDERLRELCYGVWEGIDVPSIERDYAGELELWFDKTDTCQVPQAEVIDEARERLWVCLNDIVQENPGKTIGVFTHGCAIRLIMSKLLDCSWRAAWQIRQDNCAVNILEYKDGKYWVALLNDSAFVAAGGKK